MSSSIAVLLPVRLETRFYPPGPGAMSWRLRVLIVPDSIWVDRHDPLPSAAEMEALGAFYDAAPLGLQSIEGRTAWDVLCSRVGGGARAEWLLRTYPSGIQPAKLSTPPFYGQIHGFPEKLELWMARGGQAPVCVKQWTVNPSRLDVSLPDPGKKQERWYTAWSEAQATGLGVEIDLGAPFPGNIDVLYLAGVGTTPAETLFANHRHAGLLGTIEPGTPTNAIAGSAAVDLGRSTQAWYDIAAGPNTAGAGSASFSRAVTGKTDGFGALIGDGFDHAVPGHAMMTALWSVLWGHTLKDIWNLGDAVQRAGRWASEHVLPEGAVPPVRVGNQPYGVLAASSLATWTVDPADPQAAYGSLEAGLTPYFALARASFAGLATAKGHVGGANTEKLLQLIGQQPSSENYLYRVFLSKEVLEYFYGSLPGSGANGEPRGGTGFDKWWSDRAVAVSQWLTHPARQYVATGNPHNLTLALVAPNSVPADSQFGDFFKLDLQALPSAVFNDYKKWADSPSLLARLVVQALIMTAAEVHRAANAIGGPSLEPPVSSASLSQMAQWATALTPAELIAAKLHPSYALYQMTRQAIDALRGQPVRTLERVLRATIDSACYRVDPWIQALPWRRIASSVPAARPLGAYGWVDAPRPGAPGPTAGGLLHAPSERQALTSAILRDKFINDPQPARWNMNLTSRSVRMAECIAEEVKIGGYIQEVLGREVERIAGTHALVTQLRTTYPIHDAHAGRRTCDGEAVLKANPAGLGMNASQLSALNDLRAALDAYSDLLVAQAVHDVVSGRAAIAGAAMDAAAGLSAPPDLEVIRTTRSGRSVNTSVAILLPAVPVPAVDPATSPVTMADASVAALLGDLLGDATSDAWSWNLLLPDGTTHTRMLGDLGWCAADAAAVSEDALARLIAAGGVINTAWLVRDAGGSAHTVTLASLSLSPAALHDLSDAERRALVADQAGPGSTVIGEIPQPGTRSQAKAKRALGVLGERPALPEHLAEGDLADDDVRQELLQRYDLLRQLAAVSLTSLAAQSPADALVQVARWGITPVAAGGDSIADLRAKAIAALSERLQQAPDMAAAQALDTAAITRAIAQLASSDGKFPVLSRIDVDGLPAALESTDLDRDWLTTNASVRMPLARLEAFQLDGEMFGVWTPMSAFSNRPKDPWQQDAVASASGPRSSRLIVAYSPGKVSGPMAAGLLDSWGETVPDVDQATAAAFGFNAPAARAPQAILLAVAPDPAAPLTIATTVAILAETRELARARSVMPEDLSSYSAALPMTMLGIGL